MTAVELAQTLHARKTGRGKWVAKCPAHRDRNPSLRISEGKTVPVVLKCMSAGCDTKAILGAVGLTWGALFNGKPTQEIREYLSDERKLKNLQRQHGLMMMLQALEPQRRHYWGAAIRRVIEEMTPLHWRVMPDEERFEKVREFEIKDYRGKRLDRLAGGM